MAFHNNLGKLSIILVGKGEMSWKQKIKGEYFVGALFFQKTSKLTIPFWKKTRLLLRNVQIKH